MLLEKTRQETEANLHTAIEHAVAIRDENPDFRAAVATRADLRRQLETVAPVDPLKIGARNEAHDRRVELQRAIDRQEVTVRDLDARLSSQVCLALAPLHRQLVARLGRALREVGALNDELAALSEMLDRHGIVGASSHLRPMTFMEAGRLSERYSNLNLWHRDAREHGLLAAE
jgi:hypothetical protein